MSSKIVTTFKKNAFDTVEVSLTEYKGYPLILIAVIDANGTWVSNVQMSRSLIPKLVQALEAAERMDEPR